MTNSDCEVSTAMTASDVPEPTLVESHTNGDQPEFSSMPSRALLEYIANEVWDMRHQHTELSIEVKKMRAEMAAVTACSQRTELAIIEVREESREAVTVSKALSARVAELLTSRATGTPP